MKANKIQPTYLPNITFEFQKSERTADHGRLEPSLPPDFVDMRRFCRQTA
jgi:hypothetical protein